MIAIASIATTALGWFLFRHAETPTEELFALVVGLTPLALHAWNVARTKFTIQVKS